MNIIEKLKSGEELFWKNPYIVPYNSLRSLSELVLSDADIDDAAHRLERFAPFIEVAFPETKATRGIIESELREIPEMKKALEREYNCKVSGKLFLKMDSHLPIAGSVKARGGIYEVLKHAEDIVLQSGLLTKNDDYKRFADNDVRELLSNYTVQVGSTGNLGMSIGIMSAALGFKVKIHMSNDAKEWKKELLRKRGVEVIEYTNDYSKAVEEGRRASDRDPKSYFVDDEKSRDLFLGYATAGARLQKQLDEQGIRVDENHPLVVYIPAGVGGAPGGITYGLKRIYGDNVSCYFVETTTCPSVIYGIASQKHEKACVRDLGISGKTEADGLACASPSGFVTRMMTGFVSGGFTVGDAKLYDFLRLLNTSENVRIEPSSCAAFAGVVAHAELLEKSTCVVWATGGRMIPDEIYCKYLETYL